MSFVHADRLALLLQSELPEYDFMPGTVNYEILAKGLSVILADFDLRLDQVTAQMDPVAYAARPEVTYDEVVTLVARYGVTPSEALDVSGFVTITLSTDTPTGITSDEVFLHGEQSFRVQPSVLLYKSDSAFLPANTINVHYIRITKSPSGLLYANIPVVTSVEPGQSFSPSITLTVPGGLQNVTSAKLATSFSSPTTLDTKESLAARAVAMSSGRIISGNTQICSHVRTETGVLDCGVAGAGSPLQTRDRRAGFSMGGKLDVFVRPTIAPDYIWVSLITIEDPLIPGKTVVRITPSEVPVILFVNSVSHNDQLLSFDQQRTMSVDAAAYGITDVTQAAFSSFGGIDILLSSSIPVGQTVLVQAVSFPSIVQLQAMYSSPDRSLLPSDVLMRTPVPVFVRVTCDVSGVSTEELPAVRSAMADAINATTMEVGELHVHYLIAYVSARFPSILFRLPFWLHGRMFSPLTEDIIPDIWSSASSLIPEHRSSVVRGACIFIGDASGIELTVRS